VFKVAGCHEILCSIRSSEMKYILQAILHTYINMKKYKQDES